MSGQARVDLASSGPATRLSLAVEAAGQGGNTPPGSADAARMLNQLWASMTLVCAARGSARTEARRHVVGELARPEFNQPKVGQATSHERIARDDRLYFLLALAGGDDDAAVARNLASRHQERAARVMLLEELHMRGPGRIDRRQWRLVGELDDEHQACLTSAVGVKVSNHSRRTGASH